MKRNTLMLGGALALAALTALGGYWLGQRGTGAGHGAAASQAGAVGDSPKAARKPLFYRNPMGLPDTSPVPKKDPMGMDYIAVFAGDESDSPASANQIKINTDKVQKLGVRTEAASLRVIDKQVRAAGRIEPDERRVFVIAPKSEGYVERLHVNATGQVVAKGQVLFEAYSPELVSAQREYAIAAQGVASLKGAPSGARDGMQQLADSSLLRLKNWDISDEQIRALAQSGSATRTLSFRSPVSGIVTEKKAVQGMRFMPGEMLYQVTDLSSVWVLADVFEQDIGSVKSGAKAKVSINAYPDKAFAGTVTYVYPTLKAETRTVQVRIELTNPGQLLKPGMFASVELAVAARANTVTVPVSAVIDSGTRRIVLVQLKQGLFEPREVKLGARSDDYVEVLDGVKSGEEVVVTANFLIDAESNLKAAVASFGHATHGAAPAPSASSPSSAASGAVGAIGASTVAHRAEGTVDEIDAKAATLSISHGAVASLKWPAMTMEFKLANGALLKGLQPGSAIAFEFVERQAGEWVITSLKPAAK
ncbi:MAG: efflux RND transporter periplasmic adaptor subunit, partial [Rhodoferax sp.]|nr:efflux RND transporter periplasmic adaptor subunit [Rhodoferax sp.]